ncbi:DUF3592 domain-containing protein [Kitasatospora sp. NPDC056327]|uniref:DUF3592 domain-containing protein n=1 Tax=Kitasatospora sp. NPDC056327 TaxID=3345785 RepID=UPI0035DC53D2
MATDHPPAPGPRLSRGRLVGLVVIAGFTAAAGWLTATGFVRAYGADACGPEGDCGALGTTLYLVSGLLLWPASLVAAASTAHGDAPTHEPSVTSDRGVLSGAVALGLVGAALANGGFHPWLLVPVLPLAVLAAVLDRFGARRRRAFVLETRRTAERQDRLARHGITVPGRITALVHTGSTYNDHPELRVSVEFTTADGSLRTTTLVDAFPAFDAPRRGGPAEVRYDPADPEDAEAVLVDPAPEPLQGAVRADPAPSADPALRGVEALERLAALHRDGALDAAEFTAAKARLIGTESASASVHPPYPPQDAVVHPAVRPGTDGPH